jgi:glutaredoxin
MILNIIIALLCLLAPGCAFRPSAYRECNVQHHERRFTPTRLAMSIPNPIDTLTSGFASICRTPYGVTVKDIDPGVVPIKLQTLYDIENSSSCRRVREVITELDLVVETVVPATKNSRCFLDPDYQYAIPVTTTIPRLVYLENGKEKILEGTDDIVATLESRFLLQRNEPKDTKDQVFTVLLEIGNYCASLLRIGRGAHVSPCAATQSGITVPRPKKPLILYSYEGNQFCRLVREVFTELDLPYELRSAGKGSPRRAELGKLSGGSTMCPYMVDPNKNDTKMSESADIIRYLYQNYALWTPPNEVLQWASDFILPLAKPIFSTIAPLQAGSYANTPGENTNEYQEKINTAWSNVEATSQSAPVVMYTYGLSPFSFEAKALLDNLNVEYMEVSLGAEWIPGLIKEGGSEIRAAFLEKTGQSSLPHIFIGGQYIGGLFSGTPGLLPLLEQGKLLNLINEAKKSSKTPALTKT